MSIVADVQLEAHSASSKSFFSEKQTKNNNK